MSGGFETLYSTAIITIGVLSTKEGQDIQKAAYDDLLSVYGSVDEAFDHCLTEEKSPYIVGLYKEALRFYPPIKLLPARQTYKDFNYNGSAIPKGILIYINAQAINRGKNLFFPYSIVSSTLISPQIRTYLARMPINFVQRVGQTKKTQSHHLNILLLGLVHGCVLL